MRRKQVVVGIAVAMTATALTLGCYWPFGRGPATLVLPGVVEIQEVRLGSKAGGRVARVAIKEGEIAEEGRELVTFEVPELEAQRDQAQGRLDAAVAELEKAQKGPRREEKEAGKAAVDAARARWQRLKVGWREEEIRQARDDLEAAEADAVQARRDFERVDRIFRQSAGSKADLDAARAGRDRATGRAAAARARLDMFLRGSRDEDIAEAAAELARVQANFDLLQAGTRSEDIASALAKVAELRGKVRELEAQLLEASIRAPERVLIEVVAVRKGDLVPPNQPVLRVLRADDLWVKVYVPETELGRVRLNEEVTVTIDAANGKVYHGRVEQIASISEFTPRNVQSADERRHQVFGIKVRVADPAGVFKSGMAAQVTVRLHD
jgi:multidrug resistance efflux pump